MKVVQDIKKKEKYKDIFNFYHSSVWYRWVFGHEFLSTLFNFYTYLLIIYSPFWWREQRLFYFQTKHIYFASTMTTILSPFLTRNHSELNSVIMGVISSQSSDIFFWILTQSDFNSHLNGKMITFVWSIEIKLLIVCPLHSKLLFSINYSSIFTRVSYSIWDNNKNWIFKKF